MSGELRDFDPDKVTITWVLPTGAITLHIGLIDSDNAVQDSQDKPRATRTNGLRGQQVRNKSSVRGGNLTLTYMAASQTNAVLSGITLGEDATGLSPIGPIYVRNLNGDEIATYAGCAIDSEPNVGFGATASDRVYVFGYAKRTLIATGQAAIG